MLTNLEYTKDFLKALYLHIFLKKIKCLILKARGKWPPHYLILEVKKVVTVCNRTCYWFNETNVV